ncbi:MAG: pyridoxamine 5'-phosphate oxidase family protein [Firmicutes bacterium]|nr:pyridoxamine 5'-phosphate oxidase family protein [Bacillota bacterium]
MDKIVEFLKENPIGSFATIKDGKPKVRPWGFMMMEDGKFYFTTANTKEVYKQLQETPYLEFTCSNKEGNWLRLSGEAIFTKDLEIKKKVMESSPGVKMLYQSPDNPIFEVFYVEHGQASIHEFGGKPIHEITF